jgi:GNAT superfamily N-acetyltransferase
MYRDEGASGWKWSLEMASLDSNREITFRIATSADVPAMVKCRLSDPYFEAAGPEDPRMAAYLDGQHHPQQALAPRVAYVAVAGGEVIGYIAGHLTTRHQCEGELQHLFIAPTHRRRRIGTALLGLLAKWFQEQRAQRICVAVANDSPREARPFAEGVGALPLKRNWYAWDDIGAVVAKRQPDRAR